MKLSFVPLLLGGRSLSPEARSALIENRRADAAVLLMQQFDLNCREAGELVDVSICDEEKPARRATEFRFGMRKCGDVGSRPRNFPKESRVARISDD